MRSDGERESEINETIRYYCPRFPGRLGDSCLYGESRLSGGLPDIGVVMLACPHYR